MTRMNGMTWFIVITGVTRMIVIEISQRSNE